MKILVATQNPFAAVAVEGIKKILTEAGHIVDTLEKYAAQADFVNAVAPYDALIIRSDKVTGEVMAIAGILYPITGDHVRIVPHFDEEIIRGAGRIKGRIFIISIVIIGLAYLMDKDFRKLIRLLKKEPPKSGHKGRAGKAKKEEVING